VRFGEAEEGDSIVLKRFLAACGLGLAFVFPAAATSVIPLYLDEVVDTAAIAFEGVCVSNRTEREAGTNFIVTYTTFEVRDVLKGEVASTYVIKQIGGQLPDGSKVFEIQGVPKFVAGEEYVVFLAGVSSAGFSSPIGLGQGKFSITRDAQGTKVSNGRDFRELTANIAQAPGQKAMVQELQKASQPVRDLDLDAFKQLVRDRVGRAR
jgi:hypothetical protein